MTIASKEQLEAAAVKMGMLPFFANGIPGFSVEEMAAPGMLFGEGRDDYGCWEWKGPVIQEMTTVYGKFFRRKAGFVSLGLLPDFINYRRDAYPVQEGSTESTLLGLVRGHEAMTSSALREAVYGTSPRSRKPGSLPDLMENVKPRRHSLEAPLQRLQMGAWLLIADFEYKLTAQGERYGWGVALYSTPEIWLGESFEAPCGHTPAQSFDFMVESLAARLPGVDRALIAGLIK